jgi:RNA polymerase sigma-70 factor, ECF subfamily
MNQVEEIYRRHAPAVYRFALGLCGDRARAEDLVSETFVRLLTRAPEIRTQTALAYLLAVARNTYLTSRHKLAREVPLVDDYPAPDVDPGQRLDLQAQLAATLQALSLLPEGERAALLLRADHELTYEEIAAALGITAGAAKVRVHRARIRLAEATALQRGNP